jgi:hypothetical protein
VGFREPQLELLQVRLQSAPLLAPSFSTVVLIVVWLPVFNEEGAACVKAIETVLEGDEALHAQRKTSAITEREGSPTLHFMRGLPALFHRFRVECIVVPPDFK